MSEFIETVAGTALLRRSHRRTLAISVLPDGSVELTAPITASVDEILSRVTKRLPWIREQQRAFAGMNANRTPRRFCNGATHRYLGRQYRLKIMKGEPPGVKLSGGYFHVMAGDDSEVERLLSLWMRERAREQFSRRLNQWQKWCAHHSLPGPRIRLRSMSKRWGSAHKDGWIALNPELVRMPSICIDYVIAHEICHLKHPHHGPAFFRELDQLFPGWKEAKRRLECTEG